MTWSHSQRGCSVVLPRTSASTERKEMHTSYWGQGGQEGQENIKSFAWWNKNSAPRRRFGKWNVRARNSFSFQTGCKQGSPDVWLSPWHCLATAWTTILPAWAVSPPTAWAVTCHHRAGHPPPAVLQRIQKRSVEVPVSFKGPWKTAPKTVAPSRTRLLPWGERSFYTAKGKVTPSPTPEPTWKINPSLSTDTAETAMRTPGRWQQGFEASEVGSAFFRNFGCKKKGLDVSVLINSSL